ncbi:MAG: transposase [Undibacterium sp.]|nr:transposase [Opitutaceae bacterium]
MTEALRDQGESVGPNRVARLMRESGLQGRTKRRYRVRTTDRAHDHPIADNLPANAPEPTKPGEVWVADIT